MLILFFFEYLQNQRRKEVEIANEYALTVIMDLMVHLKTSGVLVEELDVGGGLGIKYTEYNKPLSISEFVSGIASFISKKCTANSLDLPELDFEPGRSVVGEAGTTLYRIGCIIKMPNGQFDVAVNGGMNDNIRPALYQAKYVGLLANRMNQQADTHCRIAGKLCESGDILIESIKLPLPKTGDVLAVFSTGAYNYTMASNYNRLPVPGMALVNQGTWDWVVRPQTYEDILRNDLIPLRLQSRPQTVEPSNSTDHVNHYEHSGKAELEENAEHVEKAEHEENAVHVDHADNREKEVTAEKEMNAEKAEPVHDEDPADHMGQMKDEVQEQVHFE